MPKLWDRSKRERRTAFSDLLGDYLEANWPMRPKHLAVKTGLSATTIQRYLNTGVVPHDPRILQQIHAGTGIPLAQLYEAVGLWLPAPLPVEAQYLPQPRQPRQRQPKAPPRIAEQQSPYAALHEFLRSLQVQQIDDATRQALIDTFVEALQPASSTNTSPDEPPPPWDDHDAVSTLQIPTVPPARRLSDASGETEKPQQESQPAGRCR